MAIGIAPPADRNYAASQLTVTVTDLPTDVQPAGEVTAVAAGESLNVS
jgi:hypothetical protein